MDGLTTQLARFIAGAHGLALPPEVVATVRTGFIDTLAVLAAGRDEPVSRVMQAVVRARSGPGCRAPLLLGPERASARDAALVNATAAHALDYDDVALQGHPSAVLVPALLAEATRTPASGMDLLRAYVAGYEVWAELLSRDEDLHHLKGWHPTGVFGTVAVAAAVATLRRLPMEAARSALGLAASMASGLTANFGSMAKPFHAGQAAAHGLDAVDLAQAGMLAAADALEHRSGFLRAFSPAGRVNVEPLPAGWGHGLRIATLGLTVKKYPMCYATHRVIDAALRLARTHDVDVAAVESMHATVGPAQALMLRNHAPMEALQAKFSLEFSVAAAIVARKVGLAELSDGFVQRPEVQALMTKLRIEVVDSAHPDEPTLAVSDRLVITMRDGRVLDGGEVRDARGAPGQPLLPGELEDKFRDCTGRLDAGLRDALWREFGRLDLQPHASELPGVG
jgi:aconitate decarboxylase